MHVESVTQDDGQCDDGSPENKSQRLGGGRGLPWRHAANHDIGVDTVGEADCRHHADDHERHKNKLAVARV